MADVDPATTFGPNDVHEVYEGFEPTIRRGGLRAEASARVKNGS
jgi:hypothetical protein